MILPWTTNHFHSSKNLCSRNASVRYLYLSLLWYSWLTRRSFPIRNGRSSVYLRYSWWRLTTQRSFYVLSFHERLQWAEYFFHFFATENYILQFWTCRAYWLSLCYELECVISVKLSCFMCPCFIHCVSKALCKWFGYSRHKTSFYLFIWL